MSAQPQQDTNINSLAKFSKITKSRKPHEVMEAIDEVRAMLDVLSVKKPRTFSDNAQIKTLKNFDVILAKRYDYLTATKSEDSREKETQRLISTAVKAAVKGITNQRSHTKQLIGAEHVGPKDMEVFKHKGETQTPLDVRRVAILTALERGHSLKLLKKEAVIECGLGYLYDDENEPSSIEDIIKLNNTVEPKKDLYDMSDIIPSKIFKVPVVIADEPQEDV